MKNLKLVLMKGCLFVCLFVCVALSPAFAVESEGKIGFYKGGNHSSTSHLLIQGAAAADLFRHLSLARQTEETVEGIFIRRGKSMECIQFYREPSAPYRCYLHMDESGLLQPGYAPRGL